MDKIPWEVCFVSSPRRISSRLLKRHSTTHERDKQKRYVCINAVWKEYIPIEFVLTIEGIWERKAITVDHFKYWKMEYFFPIKQTVIKSVFKSVSGAFEDEDCTKKSEPSIM